MTRAPRRAVAAALLALIATVGYAGPTAEAAGSSSPPPRQGARARGHHTGNVDPALLEAGTAPSSFAPAGARVDAQGRRVVVVEGDAGRIAAAVRSVGGEVTSGAPTMVEAAVPQGRLEELGRADGVELVREPSWFQPAFESEGVSLTNADAWHTDGSDGTGIEVAIVDSGFQNYASKLGTELPVALNVETTSFCTGMGTGDHGTAVAEIVHDMAPGATLHLICIDNDADFYSAGQTIVSQGIRVANLSGGFLDGRGDGSGADTTPAGVVRTTRLANPEGVLWAIASGNLGHEHYDMVSTDRDGDSSIEFDGGPASALYYDSSELQPIAVGAGETAMLFVRWDAWPTTTQDYDVAIWDFSTPTPTFITSAEGAQYPFGMAPHESVAITNPTGSTKVYWAEIYRYQEPLGTFRASGVARFDLFLTGVADFAMAGGRITTTASTTEPATSPYAMAVGAACYANGTIEEYSGQGPTIDGRTKPDITGPDGVESSVYGDGSSCTGATGFYGTSAATPHVAGAAADYLSANPALDIAELQRLLEVRAVDAGAAGRDPVYGAGNLDLRDPLTDPPDAPTGALFTSLAQPKRVVETRSSAPGGCVGPRCGALGTGQSFTLDIEADPAVPADATAVVLNVTAVATTQTGFLTLYPAGSARPTASSLNFGPGQTLANHVTATLGTGGAFTVYNHFGTTHVVVDLVGYYSPTATQGLTPITPVRALETRTGVPSGCLPAGLHCTPFTSNETLALTVRGATFQGTTIPAAATAVVLNVTAVQPTANGYLTLWPGGTTRPTASSLNFSPGSVVPNLVVAGIGADDKVNIYNYFGSTDVVIDVLGYYEPGGARYVALDPPTRTLDTRTGNGLRLGALTGFEELPHQVGRLNGVPLDAVGALFNVTVAAPVSSGFLTVWPDGASRPTASNLNFAPGAVVSNGVLTALGTGGRIRIYNHGSSQSTPVIADLSGYFVAG